MIVLGLSGALTHDPSAALFVDGQLVSAAEEERFLRDKHAKRCWPLHAARYCLEAAGVLPAAVDAVAFPFAPFGFFYPGRWHFARRYWYAPDRALNALFNGNRLFRRNRRAILELMRQLGIDPARRLRRKSRLPLNKAFRARSGAYQYRRAKCQRPG